MKRKLKSAPVDFNAEMLPRNRKEVFFDCLKLRYPVFLWAGLVLLLFALPTLLMLLFRYYQVYGLYASYDAGAISEAQLNSSLTAFRVSLTLPLLLTLPIIGVGLSGVIYVLRQLIWGEGVYYSADFKHGIKTNVSKILTVFIIAACIAVLSAVTDVYLSSNNPVRYILFAVAFVLLFPTALYMTTMTTVYDFGLLSTVRNSFILYIKTFPVTILFTLIAAGGYLGVTYIPSMIAKFIIMPALIVFALPPYLVAFLLYSCYTFDRFINKEHHPDYVDKGVGGRIAVSGDDFNE